MKDGVLEGKREKSVKHISYLNQLEMTEVANQFQVKTLQDLILQVSLNDWIYSVKQLHEQPESSLD